MGFSVVSRLSLMSGSAIALCLAFNPVEASEKYRELYRRPKDIPYPADNPYSAAKADLGRALFFDPRLSGSDWISCSSCHNPAFSWGDGLAKGIGHGMKNLARRTATVLDLAWGELMFWDGRAASLEEQALAPVAAPGEMNLPIEIMLKKINAIEGYRNQFEVAFPGEGLRKDTMAKAIATFERTIVSGKAPFDRWIEGEEAAISENAKRGFLVFNEKAQCSQCHSGWRFTDEGFYDVGLVGEDKGRGTILPDLESMQFAFKTPTLRNADHRGPYMHDGSEATLAQVIEFYNRGGDVKRPATSEHIRALNLTERDKGDLLSFLKTLTSSDPATPISMLPR